MKFDFAPGLSPSDVALRPYISDFFIAGWAEPLTGLVDSGAVGCRVDARIGRSAGLDLSQGPTERLRIGGSVKLGHTVPVLMQLRGHTWSADVTFVEDWTAGYQVLGIDGFFNQFEVRIKASSQRFYVLPR